MINLIASDKLKALGCRWSGTEWIAPKLAQEEATSIKKMFYKNLITVEVLINKDRNLK
jgi:hypothetical protein